jgi:hypothetical protein
VQAPLAHPAQLTHLPPAHWPSAVHQHATPPAKHVPVGELTVLQLPLAHVTPPVDVGAAWQPETSALPLPEQVPVHWELAFTHLPLEQSESATHRHAVWAVLHTGAGDSVVAHVYAAPARPVRVAT